MEKTTMRLTISRFKKIAKYITTEFKNKGVDAHYSKTLEDIAKALDFNDYNTLKPLLEDRNMENIDTYTFSIPSREWLDTSNTILVGKEEIECEAKKFSVISRVDKWETNVAVMGVSSSDKTLFTRKVAATLNDPSLGERRRVIIFDAVGAYNDFEEKDGFVVIDPQDDLFQLGDEDLFTYIPEKLYMEDKNVILKVNTNEEGRGKFVQYIIEEIAEEQRRFSEDIIVVFDCLDFIFHNSKFGLDHFENILRFARLTGMVIWAIGQKSQDFTEMLDYDSKKYYIVQNRQMLEMHPPRPRGPVSDSFLSLKERQ